MIGKLHPLISKLLLAGQQSSAEQIASQTSGTRMTLDRLVFLIGQELAAKALGRTKPLALSGSSKFSFLPWSTWSDTWSCPAPKWFRW